MPLFKRSANSDLQIPPVQSASRDITFHHSNSAPDVHTNAHAGERDPDQLSDRNRNELFSGYNPAKAGSGWFLDGPNINEEGDVEAIKQKTRFVKQSSVNSTQNSLRFAREAVETGSNTLKRLGEQSEKLANTEHYLNVTKSHALQADDKTEELRKLNRSIFIPAVTINNDAKHAARETKIQRRYEERRADREQTRMDIRGRLSKEDGFSASSRANRTAERSQFQFEANGSDDEMEDQLEGNLGEIDRLARTMKALGTAMGEELDRQNGVISVIDNNAVKLDEKLHQSTVQLRRAGGK
ncbi:hypothetical protein GGX14DRAFT_616647 [Mycena pura]|uniref:t-SNARE coiled-coil homology domain-containing protein n=1 Tax=Mycena pura TaxID=153505 RepID=A0AAD6YUI8_9AGAR|nr:hypothetical protein GGX14DRAFT_616647 [Mycena pura]